MPGHLIRKNCGMSKAPATLSPGPLLNPLSSPLTPWRLRTMRSHQLHSYFLRVGPILATPFCSLRGFVPSSLTSRTIKTGNVCGRWIVICLRALRQLILRGFVPSAFKRRPVQIESIAGRSSSFDSTTDVLLEVGVVSETPFCSKWIQLMYV